MGRSKCHDNTGYSDSLNKTIASKLPIKKKTNKTLWLIPFSGLLKKGNYAMAFHTSLQISRKKCLPLLGFIHVWPYIHTWVHVARIFTSCPSSTIGSVRTSRKTLIMNDIIQCSKFHFLFLFRKITIHTCFFTYIVLSFIESWHFTQTHTIHKRRHNPHLGSFSV